MFSYNVRFIILICASIYNTFAPTVGEGRVSWYARLVDTGPLAVQIPVKPVNVCHPFINKYFVHIMWKYLEVGRKENIR